MFGEILCWFGWHKWYSTSEHTKFVDHETTARIWRCRRCTAVRAWGSK